MITINDLFLPLFCFKSCFFHFKNGNYTTLVCYWIENTPRFSRKTIVFFVSCIMITRNRKNFSTSLACDSSQCGVFISAGIFVDSQMCQ